jgi:hypothetical protein
MAVVTVGATPTLKVVAVESHNSYVGRTESIERWAWMSVVSEYF